MARGSNWSADPAVTLAYRHRQRGRAKAFTLSRFASCIAHAQADEAQAVGDDLPPR